MNEANQPTDNHQDAPFSIPARLGFVFVAALSSFGFSGLGQIYTRQWKRAAAYFVGSFACWFFLLGWAVHLAGMVDAIVTTWKVTGEPDARSDDRWGLVWTGAFVAIGFAFLGGFSVVLTSNTELVEATFDSWGAVLEG